MSQLDLRSIICDKPPSANVCPICIEPFTKYSRAPLIICTYSIQHVVCSECVVTMDETKAAPFCPLCRAKSRHPNKRAVNTTMLIEEDFDRKREVADAISAMANMLHKEYDEKREATVFTYRKCHECAAPILNLSEAYSCLECNMWHTTFWDDLNKMHNALLSEIYCGDCKLTHFGEKHSKLSPRKIQSFMRPLYKLIYFGQFDWSQRAFTPLNELITKSLADSNHYDLSVFAQILTQAFHSIPSKMRHRHKITQFFLEITRNLKDFPLLHEYFTSSSTKTDLLTAAQRHEIYVWVKLMFKMIDYFAQGNSQEIKESYLEIFWQNHYQLFPFVAKEQLRELRQDIRRTFLAMSARFVPDRILTIVLSRDSAAYTMRERSMIIRKTLLSLHANGSPGYVHEIYEKLCAFVKRTIYVETADMSFRPHLLL